MQLYEQHCSAKSKPQILTEEQCSHYLKEIPQWTYSATKKNISRHFSLKDYYQTLAFINAIAWVVHQENHHPNIEFSYNACTVYFTTHSAKGVTLFDFICASHIDQLTLKNNIT